MSENLARLREPLGRALAEETARMTRLITTVWQSIMVMGIAMALVVALYGSYSLGIGSAVAATIMLACFSFQAWCLRRDKYVKQAMTVGIFVEGTMPWTMMIVLIYAQGPAYALGSWVPPMLFLGAILTTAMRLEPMTPLFIGLIAAVAHLAIYFIVIEPRLSAAQADFLLNAPLMQVTRSVTFAIGGVLAMFVSRTLRVAIARADRRVRQRELFGKYRIVDTIASGGMGTVYRALYCPEGGFERPVAIKRIHAHLAAQERFVHAFRVEAELCARLVHPNIVQVLDFGRTGGAYFLSMELVDGLTLRQLLSRLTTIETLLPSHVVVHIGRELLAGLAYAHHGARGSDGRVLRVVHRDLSPSNVLLSRNGEVKVSDFGVAKALRDASASDTRTMVGHAAYMSPEQASGEPIDERSDLFAVASVLWETLCGQALFARDGDGPTFFAIVNSDVPAPSAIRAGLPPRWDAFFARALDRDPERRYQDAEAMSTALSLTDDAHVTTARDDLAELVALAVNADIPDSAGHLEAEDMEPTKIRQSQHDDTPTREFEISHLAG